MSKGYDWLRDEELGYLNESNEWHTVLLDLCKLIQNYDEADVDRRDVRLHAARAITFVKKHIETER
jgi:hypothetical protein